MDAGIIRRTPTDMHTAPAFPCPSWLSRLSRRCQPWAARCRQLCTLHPQRELAERYRQLPHSAQRPSHPTPQLGQGHEQRRNQQRFLRFLHSARHETRWLLSMRRSCDDKSQPCAMAGLLHPLRRLATGKPHRSRHLRPMTILQQGSYSTDSSTTYTAALETWRGLSERVLPLVRAQHEDHHLTRTVSLHAPMLRLKLPGLILRKSVLARQLQQPDAPVEARQLPLLLHPLLK